MLSKEKEKVSSIIDEYWSEQTCFLQNIVNEKSTLLNEESVQLKIARKLKQLELEVDVFDIDVSKISRMEGYSACDWKYDNRPVVVGTMHGRREGHGKSLVLNGHADVVSENTVRHWNFNPWKGTIVGNRMYGRGTADMKCGLSAMIYAVSALKLGNIKLDGDVIIQSVIEEEASGNGTLACIEKGYIGDAVLVTECTNNKLVTTAVGSLWLKVIVDGHSGHVTGKKSVNAIEEAYKVIDVLKRLEKKWNTRKHAAYKNFEKPINFNVGRIKGGEWPSSVPSECEFHVRIAIYPGINPVSAQEEVERFIRSSFKTDDWLANNPPKLYWYGHRSAGFDVNKKNSLFDVLKENHKIIHQEQLEIDAVTATNDMRLYALYTNIPVAMYGGIGGNMHAADEFVELDSVKKLTKFIAYTIIDWCK